MSGGETTFKPTVYGEAAANDANVAFPITMALEAARAAYRLGDAVDESRTTMNTHNATHLTDADFQGPHADVSDDKVSAYRTSSGNMARAFRTLAGQIAEGWAAARGQQDRINFARYVEDETSNDGWAENAGETIGIGSDDHGAPPEDPPIPSASGFEATRDAMHTDFGP